MRKKCAAVFVLLVSFLLLSGFTFDDNPVDDAFKRFCAEQSGLEDNTVLSYLYAKAWANELNFIWYDRGLDAEFGYRKIEIEDAAYRYAVTLAGSPADAYKYIALVYKMAVYDITGRVGGEASFITDADALYETLAAVNYESRVPEDVSILETLSDEKTPMPVIAALPEKDVYYFLSDMGAVVTVAGDEKWYPWYSITPRLVLPELALRDFDGDGEDELAVICYIGSGTGVSIMELHIIEFEDGRQAYASIVDGKLVRDMLYHRLSAEYDPASEEITVTLDGQAVTVDVSGISKEVSRELRGLNLLDRFEIVNDNGKLSAKIDIGINAFDYVSPCAYVNLRADIVYTDNGGWAEISLENCELYVEE